MRMSPPLTVTEDTPADMLAGSMDLDIILPSGHIVRNSVLRSTPMMDLLVQVTTAHRLSPGSHSLQAMGERGALPYKPSTPIGALDTFTVRIVQKKPTSLKKAPQVPQALPTTFRLQVHLPRSQLFVVRITPLVTVGDVLSQVCREKNLDTGKYELRITGNMNQPLEVGQTLGELDTQELTLVVRGADHVRQMSSADIMHVKQANNRQSSTCDSSLSSGSLESRSISPVVMPAPQPPQRKKRRPAPKPPEIQKRSVVISHSRESSDSSGYHEPSTLSESPTHGGPPSDISNMASRGNRGLSNMAPRNSHSLSNLTSLPPARLPSSASVTSLSSNGPSRKKRAPPPPPMSPPTEAADVKTKSATLPADMRRQPDTEVVAAPPPPVELAPSPPTSPDFGSPILHPGMLETPLDAEKPTPAPRKPQKMKKEPAFDEEDEELALETRKEIFEPQEIEPVAPKVLGPKPVLPEKPKHLIGSFSTNALLTKKMSNLQKTQSASDVFESKLRDDFEFHSISRWENNSRINVEEEESDGSSQSDFTTTETRMEPSTTAQARETISEGLSDESCSDDDGGITMSSEPPPSLEGLATDVDSQPDSLSVDWEYQLPPPPSHFRDVAPPMTPTPTDGATLGTLGTLDTEVTLDLEKPDLFLSMEGVDRSLHPLNGIYEDNEVDTAKPVKTEPAKPIKVDPVKAAMADPVKIVNLGVDETDRVVKKPTETEKVLVHKSEVMSELTNVLSRNRLQEKSQSFSNLYFPSATLDGKKKANTLSHSQSFLTPPISNFKISNYEARAPANDAEFKKPAVPPVKQNGVRRADSMNVKKMNLDNMEVLQQHFLQFLQEKHLLDSGVELEDLSVLSAMLPPRVSVQETKVEREVEKITPVVVKEVKKVVAVLDQVPVFIEKEERLLREEVPLPVEPVAFSATPIVNGKASLTTLQPVTVSTTAIVNDKVQRNRDSFSEPVREVKQVVKEKPVYDVPKKEEKVIVRRPAFQPPAISMGTWGERPKSKVVIKDEDYTTKVNLTERRPPEIKQTVRTFDTPVRITPEKKTVIAIKKPTNYELFSALKRREQLEAEEEEKDQPRLPVVCAVELKKEFRSEPDLIRGLQQPEKRIIKIEDSVTKSDVPKTSSVYVNGFTRPQSWNVDAQNGTKARPGLMPVVKGFRASYNQPERTPEPIVKQESLPEPISRAFPPVRREESLPAKLAEPIRSQGIPPPPPIGAITLRPVGNRPIKPKISNDDPRGELLEQIRSFGGLNRLRKTVQ